MSTLRPVALVAAVAGALALHSALLLWPVVQGGGPDATARPYALQVRSMTLPMQPPTHSHEVDAKPATKRDSALSTSTLADTMTPGAEPSSAQPVQPVQSVQQPRTSRPSMGGPPEFSPTAPELPLPDASLPPNGVQLRVYLEASAEGVPTLVSIAPIEPDAPGAFAAVTEHELRSTRLVSSPGTQAYCLLISFQADTATPRLAWLPGLAQQPQRCLSGPMPPPQPLR